MRLIVEAKPGGRRAIFALPNQQPFTSVRVTEESQIASLTPVLVFSSKVREPVMFKLLLLAAETYPVPSSDKIGGQACDLSDSQLTS